MGPLQLLLPPNIPLFEPAGQYSTRNSWPLTTGLLFGAGECFLDNLMSDMEAMVGIRSNAMLREELSSIQHVSQDLAETIFIDECKQPFVTIPA
jgi:hypothetical protein